MESAFQVDLPAIPLELHQFNSFRPSNGTKCVQAERHDDVLLTLSHGEDLLPWARIDGFYALGDPKKYYLLARVRICQLITVDWIDSQTYAPHLVVTNERRFIPASSIKQRVFTCRDTRSPNQVRIWINWWLTWGDLKYPIDHRDEILTKYYRKNPR